MTKKLTAKEVLKLLKKAVDEKGADYIDPYAVSSEGCKYFKIDDNGNPDAHYPSCIVGNIAAQADIDEFVQALIESNEADVSSVGALEDLLTAKALVVLEAAQQAQDKGKTWGEAYEKAVVARVQYPSWV